MLDIFVSSGGTGLRRGLDNVEYFEDKTRDRDSNAYGEL